MITSLKNPLVRQVATLRDKRRSRETLGQFLIEGDRELYHAVQGGVVIEQLFFCPELITDNQHFNCQEQIDSIISSGQNLDKRISSSQDLVAVSPQVYARIAYREKVEGLVAIARQPDLSLADLKLSPQPLLLVVQGLEKPGNLGALLRTADAVGVDAVLVCDAQLDLYNPNVIRSSLGAIFTLPVLSVTLADAVAWLENHKIQIILSSPAATMDYSDADYTVPVAVVLGSEKQGLPPPWLQQHICQVKIPMQGRMDSLNVSVSGAVILYEALRQRKLDQK
ncbi:MAG: RNA methyltransferase [Sedimentisphaerales bacterium]|nr:RNA methyltransferase [Sedimentisphaerales bacterium]